MPDLTEYIDTPMHGKTLTVGGLIEELQKFSKDLPVLTEGCDCYGDAFKLSEYSGGHDNFVLIERQPIERSPRPNVPPATIGDLFGGDMI